MIINGILQGITQVETSVRKRSRGVRSLLFVLPSPWSRKKPGAISGADASGLNEESDDAGDFESYAIIHDGVSLQNESHDHRKDKSESDRM